MTDADRSQSESTDQTRLDELSRELAALGAESRTARQVKTVVPWLVSLGVHVGIGVLAFLITWSVVKLSEEEPIVVVADFEAMEYEPLEPLSPIREQEPTETAAENLAPIPSLNDLTSEQPVGEELSPLAELSQAAGQSSAADFAPAANRDDVSFAGVRASNARRIVYVVDASGSMIGSLAIIMQELARSLEMLRPPQEFCLIFFQRNDAIIAPPRNRLISATPKQQQRVLAWAKDKENVFPAGRSNPLAAIRAAMRLNPDTIFLLSNNITGSGEFEIDQSDLLTLLDKLNPIDPESGRRTTQIQCIQFLDPDPLDTLRKIAERHGGPNGYTFLDRGELGMTGR